VLINDLRRLFSSCASCASPLKHPQSLGVLKGASLHNVKAGFEPKEAVVTFDDAKASVEQLTEATKQVGFPSSVKPGK